MSESPIELRGKGGGVVFQGTQSPGGGSQPLTGSGAPSDSDGVDGQLYIDTDTHDIYLKADGSWT